MVLRPQKKKLWPTLRQQMTKATDSCDKHRPACETNNNHMWKTQQLHLINIITICDKHSFHMWQKQQLHETNTTTTCDKKKQQVHATNITSTRISLKRPHETNRTRICDKDSAHVQQEHHPLITSTTLTCDKYIPNLESGTRVEIFYPRSRTISDTTLLL